MLRPSLGHKLDELMKHTFLTLFCCITQKKHKLSEKSRISKSNKHSLSLKAKMIMYAKWSVKGTSKWRLLVFSKQISLNYKIVKLRFKIYFLKYYQVDNQLCMPYQSWYHNTMKCSNNGYFNSTHLPSCCL